MPYRSVSAFCRSFSKENRNSFRSKFKSIQALIVRFGYRWLRHFEPEHAAHWLNWGRKEYMFQYLLSTIILNFMEFPDDRCHGWKLWMSKLSSELRLTVTCHMCSEQWIFRGTSWYVPLTLFFDRYHLRETPFFRDRSDPEGRRYRTKEAKQKMKEKKKKKRAIKDHKNDWLTDATRLQLVMKNKWTRSSF